MLYVIYILLATMLILIFYFNKSKCSNNNDDFLVLVFGDSYYINTIRNFYYNIIVKYNITKFVVATSTLKSFNAYRNLSIPVELIKYNLSEYKEHTEVFSKHFIEKMQIRAYTLYYFMKNGKSLLHIDADTYFFKNPIQICKMNIDTDILFACDGKKCKYYNTGYMYNIYYIAFNRMMRHNERVTKFLETVYNTMISSDITWLNSIQGTMNRIIRNKIIKNLKIETLSDDIFVDGYNFFNHVTYKEDIKQMGCYGFHNDFTSGIIAKEFRLKELNLYSIDDDEYYSSINNKYISFDFSLSGSKENIKSNLNRLLCLAKNISRIIILPKIECPYSVFYFMKDKRERKKYFSYIDIMNIEVLDKKYGKNYRESSFLDNDIVPQPIKSSILFIDKESVHNIANSNISILKFSKRILSNYYCEGDYIQLCDFMQDNHLNLSKVWEKKIM